MYVNSGRACSTLPICFCYIQKFYLKTILSLVTALGVFFKMEFWNTLEKVVALHFYDRFRKGIGYFMEI